MPSPKNTATRLTALRKKSGKSYGTVAREVYDLLGAFAPTEPTIVNYHNGTTKKPDLMVLLALAEVYGVPLSDISPTAAEQLVASRDLLVPHISWCSAQAA